MVRQNSTKAKLKAGGAAFGVTVGLNDPDLVELAGLLGFDFVIVDCEHDLFDEGALVQIIRAADLQGMATIPRMHNNSQLVLHALDGGSQGVLIARVNTAADAQAVVDAAKFHPEGKRTIFYRSRGGGFALDIGSPKQWTLDTNQETMVGCIIEEITAVNNLAEILAVPGVDFIDLGPLDMAHSMGWPEQSEVAGLVDKVIADSVKAGKAVVGAANMDNLPAILDRGFRMLTVSPREYFQSGAAQFLRYGQEVLASKGLTRS